MFKEFWKFYKNATFLRNPCKRCIVKPACSRKCDEKNLYDRLFEGIGRKLCFFQALSMMLLVLIFLSGISLHLIRFINGVK
jgi:hypothetical protein